MKTARDEMAWIECMAVENIDMLPVGERCPDETPCKGCYERADARAAALAAAGFKVIEREPTEAMDNAARDWSHKKYGKPIGNDASQGCWRAMFDAAEPQEKP